MSKSLSYYIFSIFFLFSCASTQEKEASGDRNKTNLTSTVDAVDTMQVLENDITALDSNLCGLNFYPDKNYNKSKTKIANNRLILKERYLSTVDTTVKEVFLDSVMRIFSDQLLNEIIPYWYGTSWDFNGYTAVPNSGKIACGYFVSTTLRDMGLNLNRYKLAQQNPENEAKSIAIDAENLVSIDIDFDYTGDTIHKIIQEFDQGLYFVGLGNHVGFLLINNGNSFFIHSNYIDGMVMTENSKFSDAFLSQKYYFSRITDNKALALKWLMNEELYIFQ